MQKKLFQDELSKTEEYKKYASLRNKFDDYERGGELSKKEHDALVKEYSKAEKEYNKKINEVNGRHESEILEARLKDLKLPSDAKFQKFYKEYNKTRFASVEKYYKDDPSAQYIHICSCLEYN